MKEITWYEAFDGKQFWTKKECAEYESKHSPTVETDGVKWYDKNFQPLKMDYINWPKVKYMKVESHIDDINFYDNFVECLELIEEEEDTKFSEYCEIDVIGKTLLIWDEEKEEWCNFFDALYMYENFQKIITPYREIFN